MFDTNVFVATATFIYMNGEPKEHRTVSRVTGLLEAVAHRGETRMHELAEAIDAPKSSVFTLVKGLVSAGYLAEEGGAYRLGPALGDLLPAGPSELAEAARPSLEALREECGETAMLGTAVGNSLLYVDSAESREPIRYSAPLRLRRPLYPPSSGKVLLAHRPDRDARLEALLPQEKQQEARAELDEVRAEGLAFNRGETQPDVSAAARPVVVDDRVVAALAVAGPSARIGHKLRYLADKLTAAAGATGQRLTG